MSYQKIAFLGLGLIGGSIAKSIHAKFPGCQMIASDPSLASLHLAQEEGIILNRDNLSLADYASCDLIFLCAPVGVNIAYLSSLRPLIGLDTVITDVSSVKGEIQQAVIQEDLAGHFIGGHPMAGSEKIGYENASTLLLENAYYLITHTDAILQDRVSEFASFIHALGARPMVMKPEEHDRATAAISHLPHIISASLVNLVEASDDESNTLKAIASGGFRDITRISSSSPVMWEHICLSNREQILSLIDAFEGQLARFRQQIESSDGPSIQSLFANAKEYRDSLPIRGKGAIPDLFEFYCDLKDEVGGIATIATILGLHQINIRNIGIVHNREFLDGVLKIEFYNEDAMQEAIALLQKHSYQVHIR